jgi:hypothetical protein
MLSCSGDETRGRLLEVIEFKIKGATQSCAQIVVKGGEGKGRVQPVEDLISVEGARCACKDAQAESAQLHVVGLTPFAAGKRTSNSVQSFSERTRRKSPLCSRASSRARFKPIP